MKMKYFLSMFLGWISFARVTSNEITSEEVACSEIKDVCPYNVCFFDVCPSGFELYLTEEDLSWDPETLRMLNHFNNLGILYNLDPIVLKQDSKLREKFFQFKKASESVFIPYHPKSYAAFSKLKKHYSESFKESVRELAENICKNFGENFKEVGFPKLIIKMQRFPQQKGFSPHDTTKGVYHQVFHYVYLSAKNYYKTEKYSVIFVDSKSGTNEISVKNLKPETLYIGENLILITDYQGKELKRIDKNKLFGETRKFLSSLENNKKVSDRDVNNYFKIIQYHAYSFSSMRRHILEELKHAKQSEQLWYLEKLSTEEVHEIIQPCLQKLIKENYDIPSEIIDELIKTKYVFTVLVNDLKKTIIFQAENMGLVEIKRATWEAGVSGWIIEIVALHEEPAKELFKLEVQFEAYSMSKEPEWRGDIRKQAIKREVMEFDAIFEGFPKIPKKKNQPDYYYTFFCPAYKKLKEDILGTLPNLARELKK